MTSTKNQDGHKLFIWQILTFSYKCGQMCQSTWFRAQKSYHALEKKREDCTKQIKVIERLILPLNNHLQ